MANKNEKISDKELLRIRQEVLEWVDRMERKAGKKPFLKGNISLIKNKFVPATKNRGKSVVSSQSKVGAKENKHLSVSRKNASKQKKLKTPLPPKPFNRLESVVDNKALFSDKKKFLASSFFVPSLKKVILSLIFSFLIFIILITWGIYYKGWRGWFPDLIMKKLPIPAMLVDGEMVSCSDYIFIFDTFKNIAIKNNKTDISSSVIKESTKEKIIADLATRHLAKEYGVSVTKDDIEKAYQSIVYQSGSMENFQKAVLETYSWNVKNFKEKVLLSNIKYQRLIEAIKASDLLKKTMEDKMENILSQIVNNQLTFEDAASLYSHDITSGIDGSLGYIMRGQLTPEVEEIVFNLAPGKISKIIKLPSGYYVYKVDEAITGKTDEDGDELLSKTRVVSVNLKQIYFSPEKSAEEIIQERIAQAKVKVFIK